MDASRNSTSGKATNTNGSESSPRLSSARIANDSSLDTASLLSREDSDPEKGLPHERPGLEGLGLGSSGDRESSRSPAYGVLTSGVINEGPVEFKLCVCVCVCVWMVWLCVDKQKPGVVLELEWKGARVNLGAIARQLSRSYTS
jgi:hypothetical protein